MNKKPLDMLAVALGVMFLLGILYAMVSGDIWMLYFFACMAVAIPIAIGIVNKKSKSKYQKIEHTKVIFTRIAMTNLLYFVIGALLVTIYVVAVAGYIAESIIFFAMIALLLFVHRIYAKALKEYLKEVNKWKEEH